jgi:hypothetical protein
MKKSLMKKRFLYFLQSLIIGILIAYLFSHDLIRGIVFGLEIGAGYLIFSLMHERTGKRDSTITLVFLLLILYIVIRFKVMGTNH